MSSPTDIVRAGVWEDGGLFLMARIKGHAGVNITQATIASISVKSYDKASATLITTLVPVVAAAVFDALQTSDPRWTKDTTGYNFGFQIPGSAFPSGNTTYRVEVMFTPVSGDPFPLVAEITAQNLYGST